MDPTRLLRMTIACSLMGCAGGEAVSTTTLTAAPSPVPTQATGAGPRARTAPPIDRVAPLELWRQRYPQSALVLDEWAVANPRAASRLAAFSESEPEKLEVLVFWSVTNPNAGAPVFLMDRSSWSELRDLAHEEPEALAAFMHWARGGPAAADELAVRHGGLAYVLKRPK